MAGVTLPYRLNNRLADEIEQERARQTLHFEKRISIAEVEKRLSEYCSISVETIKKIKSGHIRPSILTALKMAEYFDCKVHELFWIEEGEKDAKKGV